MDERAHKRLKVSDPIGNLLKSVKVNSTLFPSLYSTPVTTKSTSTLKEAFKLLIENQILAIPVLSDDGKVSSVLSMSDIVSILVENFSEAEIRTLDGTSIWKSFDIKDQESTGKQLEKINLLFSRKLSEFKFEEAVKLSHNSTLEEAVDLILSRGIQRVIVVNDDDTFLNFVTQSRILEVLSTILHAVADAQKSLQDLEMIGIAVKDVVHVLKTDTALKAFKLMKEKKVSSVVVIDALGHSIGNISLNDLKLLEFDFKYFELLGASVEEYMEAMIPPETRAQHKYKALHRFLSKSNRKIVTCSLSDSLISVVSTLKHYHIHRIFVEDDQGHPIGVLSILDLLKGIHKLGAYTNLNH